MNKQTAPASHFLSPQRALGALLVGGALVFAGGQFSQAIAQPGAHHGAHHGAQHGAHHAPGLPFAGRGFERVLDEVKATDAQRQQIKQITDQARTDLQALHQQGRDAHQQGMAIWTSPKLDAADAEKHRQQMLAHHDQVSKRMMQAMLDVGKVLSPEQRAQAAQILKQRHDRMGEAQPGNPGDRMQNQMRKRPVAPPSQAPSAPVPAR
nr:Spy/CpxP family protein refolding chaperone [uncultured Aquabacterium sp.]